MKRVLVANRREIAVRIIRACHAGGLETVAVYSDADAQSRWARIAGHAIHIGASSATKSYLNADVLVAAARESKADAVHPGYGFLSERSGFARSVAEAGLTFVGPPAERRPPVAAGAVSDPYPPRRSWQKCCGPRRPRHARRAVTTPSTWNAR